MITLFYFSPGFPYQFLLSISESFFWGNLNTKKHYMDGDILEYLPFLITYLLLINELYAFDNVSSFTQTLRFSFLTYYHIGMHFKQHDVIYQLYTVYHHHPQLSIMLVRRWSLKWRSRMFALYLQKSARFPSSFSSIAIELNVPREWFSLIAVELNLVRRGHGFKKYANS